jgi:hypothetical protein
VRRLLVLGAVGLLAAGCGSSAPSLGAGAAGVPADAQAFVAVRTDDPNWRLFVRAALGRVPKVPAGTRVLEAALVHGKLVVPRSSVAHPLADYPRYRAARAAMPGGLRGIAYLSGSLAAERLHRIPGQITITTLPRVRVRLARRPRAQASIARLPYRWGALWLTRDGLGARIHSGGLPVLRSFTGLGAELFVTPYTARLFDEIPADATMVVDLPFPAQSWESLPRLPAAVTRLVPQVSTLELGASLDTIFGGESALYRRPGGEITVVTSPADTAAAQRELAFLFPHRRLHVATLGGQLVFSTRARGVADFRGGGDKLSSKVQLPELVTFVVYTPSLLAWGQLRGRDPTLTVHFNRRRG